MKKSGWYGNFTTLTVLVLAHGNVGGVAQTNLFEVMSPVKY